jgi:hypothetical protein
LLDNLALGINNKHIMSPTSSSSPYKSAPAVLTSRRAKVEQKKLLRQTFFFLALAIVIAVVMLAVVVPGIIRVLGGLSSSTSPVVTEDLPPLQPPVISAPVPATFSASLKLSGFAEKAATVVLVQNGQEAGQTTAQDNGAFQFDVQLQKGENALSAYAKTSEKRQSAVSQEFKVVMDNELPKLEITDPKEGEKKSVQGKKNQSTSITGNTDPNTKITLNDRLAFVKADGSFTASFFLQTGDNEITIKATDQAGNVTEKKVTITYQD